MDDSNSHWCRPRHWQRQRKRAPLARRTSHRQPALMLGRDPARDSETETGALAVSRDVLAVEALEDPLLILQGYARALVPDAHLQPSARLLTRDKNDGVRRRELASVVEQDEQQLPEMIGASKNSSVWQGAELDA